MNTSSFGEQFAKRFAPRQFLLAIVMAVIGLAAGCAQYRAAPISASLQAGALDTRSLDDPRLHAFIAASEQVPSASADTSWDLGKLTLAALYYHPDIEIARSKLELAEAAEITAGQIPNPTVSADIGTAPWAISPAISFLIETFGRREYRTAQAQALIDAARQDLATAAWQVRGRVRIALLNLWAARQRSDFLQQRLSLQDQLVYLLERRLVEGEASSLDVTRERINRNQVSLALRDAERLAADARAQLAAAVGVPVQALEDKPLSFDAFANPQFQLMDTAELRRLALTGRSDVQGLLAEYRAEESAVQLEVAKQYPNFTLGPGYTFDTGNQAYELTLAAAAELPIFNQNQGPLAEAEARRRGVGAQVLSLQAKIIGAIDAASASYRTATATVATADALVSDARRRNEQISRSFEAGEADRPTLVAARIELAIAELSRFEAAAQQRQAIGAFEDALQRQLFDPEASFTVPENSLLQSESTP